MRIADILRDPDDEPCCGHRDTVAAVHDSPSSSSSSSSSSGRRERGKKRASSRSPRCLLSRWLPSTRFLKCRSCREEYEDGEAAEVDVGGEASFLSSLGSAEGAGPLVSAVTEQEGSSGSEAMAAASSSSGGALDSVASEDRRMDGSVWKAEQTYLTIGMGAGLLFLLTRSVTEFNKMTQLREEMEVLLKGIKDAMRGKDASPSSDESKNNVTFCGSDSRPDTELSNDLSMRDCYPRLELVETTCDAESPGMDEMEAELESELELLQLNLIEQDSSGQRGVEFSGERTDSSESFSVCLGEHYEPKKGAEQDEEEETRDQYGVCPHELTTRLHELVEKRQQERISELESALELVHVKLREKETEVCWWRDAAEFVSQNNQGTLLG